VKLETRVGLFILLAIGVFLYLSINIRAIRLDKDQYYSYKAYFDDTSGLNAKAPIKIAGVEIGWVEEINLLADGKAQLIMRIQKNIKLAKNAYAMIHQDGLIGTKNLEIDPGDPSTGFLLPGGTLSMPGRTPASVGELLDQFRDIATTIQDITASFKSVFASRKGEENMRVALNSIAVASDRIADFSEVLQRTMRNNEDNLNYIVSDLKDSMQNLKEAIPTIKSDFHELARNLGKTSHQAGDAFSNVSDAAIQGRETLREAGEVVEKINTGKGVLGKLINEEETYTDVKKTVRGFRDYVDKSTGLSIGIDMHSETMLRHTNSKGYFELRLRPNTDYFYQVQLCVDEKGSLTRDVIYTERQNQKGYVLKPTELPIPLEWKVLLAEKVEVTTRRKNDLLLGLQFGKRFDRLAFRIGLFEGAFGAGCDYYVPLPTDKLHWITTLEAFDFRGWKHLHHHRPHVKWLNRAFFFKNIYSTFGLDDIFSKSSANPFIGGGIRFNDDDLKYFISAFSSAGSIGKTGR
jgi:phospholipid/cholesterol/gamma-HCH transport system substrate-binding protein